MLPHKLEVNQFNFNEHEPTRTYFECYQISVNIW